MEKLRYDEDSEHAVEDSNDSNLDAEERDCNGFGRRTSRSPDVRFPCTFPGFSCLVQSQKLQRWENKCMFGLIIDCINDDSYFCFTE